MLEGLMQHDHPLTVQHIVDRMRTLYSDSEVVTLRDDGVTRASYGDVVKRVARLCGVLTKLGIQPGDRVATFAWNSQEHFEIYLGAPSMGAVLHTLNIRLAAEQLTYIANHAEDKVVFVDDSLVPLLKEIAPTFETVEHFVVIGDGDAEGLPNALRYEELLAEQPEEFDYPELDDRAAAGLCYTSGTTGNPKGVLYSHRSQILHGMAALFADNLGLRSTDRVLPVVPMFHANAWGLTHAAPLTGADLVMPNRFLQGEPLAKLIESEKVTVAGGVPTVWLDLLNYIDSNDVDVSSLRIVPCGGSR
jgi:fatty-acyl-CoA synthase